MSILRRIWNDRGRAHADKVDSKGTETVTVPVAESDGWDRADASWFEGKLFHHRDPLSYRRVALEELVTASDDVVWRDQPVEPYPVISKFQSFIDQDPSHRLSEELGFLPYMRPASFIMARSDVALSGYRTFIGRDLHYNLDESFTTDEIALIETARLGHPEIYRNEMIGFKDTDQPGVFRLDTEGKRFITISEPVICLSSNEAPNYGSFIYRIFPKLLHVARLDPSLKILVPVYFDTLREFLRLAGIDEARIIPQYLDHIYYIRRAIVPSMRNRDIWLDDQTLAFYDGLRQTYGAPVPSRRVYLSRKSFKGSYAATRRVMTNEPEVIAVLEKLGFDIVEPETLSPLKQIALFSSASIVIAAGGSALFNTVFCHPNIKLIDIEGEPHWAGGHARLFKSRGLRFGIFAGTPDTLDFSTHHVPFHVDIPRFERRLGQFLSDVAQSSPTKEDEMSDGLLSGGQAVPAALPTSKNVMPDHAGEVYATVLAMLHQVLQPKSYFEIGTLHGDTLATARCASVSVDPQFTFSKPELIARIVDKPKLLMFQTTSDDFFAENSLRGLFGDGVDFAFLDGMHHCEFLLRDFINTERNAKPGSVIAMHDCLPVEVPMADRVPNASPATVAHRNGWWTGDVWRAALLLKRVRKDLTIIPLDCFPTGLILITGLDQTSTILQDKYDEHVASMMSWSLADISIAALFEELEVQSVPSLTAREQLESLFGSRP